MNDSQTVKTQAVMPTLKKGDRIAILSPASVIAPELVKGACDTLRAMGFEPMVMAHTLGQSGSFSGSASERLEDFRQALRNPEVKAILCSRGGYGCVHLLDALDSVMDEKDVVAHPKWLVGFSDVTALHALWGRHGWMSLHASMAKQLAHGGPEDLLNRQLIQLMSGDRAQRHDGETSCSSRTSPGHGPVIELRSGFSGSAYARNIPDVAEGKVVGGNVAVWGDLLGTPYSQIAPGTILVMEDIAEPIYKIERILWQLRLAGIFDKLAGLVVGQFTDTRAPSRDHQDMYQMIDRFLKESGSRPVTKETGYGARAHFPVVMDVAVGHVDGNQPLLLNAPARLEVTAGGAILRY